MIEAEQESRLPAPAGADREDSTFAALVARRRVSLGFVCGGLALWFARPTWRSLALGGVVALVGEGVRLWAAGHLEKGLEVTRSGPYRWVRHPLYLGSAILAVGIAIAAADPLVAGLVAVYIGVALTVAMRQEDAGLARRFGDQYRRYRDGSATDPARSFSLRRALSTNREHRGFVGLAVAAGLLALKAWWR